MFNPSFPVYRANIKVVKPYSTSTLKEWLELIKDSPYKDIFHSIEEASKKGDDTLKSRLKSKLFFCNPCVTTDGKNRSYSNITGFTGLMPLDFDNLSSESDAEYLKQYLFKTYPEVVTSFLSPSKLGVKCLVRIPVVSTVEEYKEYFYGMAYYLEDIQGFDITCQNPVLPLFLSTDDHLLQRDTNYIWRTRGERIGDFNSSKSEVPPTSFKPTETDKKVIEEWVMDRFSQIQTNGHPQVLAISTTLGGFVGYGYITQYEAEQLVTQGIRSSYYLHKNLDGYTKSAIQCINYGTSKPMKLWTTTSKD